MSTTCAEQQRSAYHCDGCGTLKTVDSNEILECISCDIVVCPDCDERLFSNFYINDDKGTEVICDKCYNNYV